MSPAESPRSRNNAKRAKPTSTAQRPRKKPKRPCKRFLWHEELHLRFVAAIFDLGLKNASPKTLLPLMEASDPDAGLTTEHLKSHLQKYRLNYERSRREFRELCDREVKRKHKHRRLSNETSGASNHYVFPTHNVSCRQEHKYGATDSESGPDTVELRSSTDEAAAVSTYNFPEGYGAVQETLDTAPAVDSMSELTDVQWRTFSSLMSGPRPNFGGNESADELPIQIPGQPLTIQEQVQDELKQTEMNRAMQAQMNFHRQMLTRKVELAHTFLPATSGVAVSTGRYASRGSDNRFNAQDTAESDFEQAWASSQQIDRQMISQSLQQRPSEQHSSTLAESTASTYPSLQNPTQSSTRYSRPYQPGEVASDIVGEQLQHWDPFNVGLDNDDLFDFLKA